MEGSESLPRYARSETPEEAPVVRTSAAREVQALDAEGERPGRVGYLPAPLLAVAETPSGVIHSVLQWSNGPRAGLSTGV
jgi:hypothetical protein